MPHEGRKAQGPVHTNVPTQMHTDSLTGQDRTYHYGTERRDDPSTAPDRGKKGDFFILILLTANNLTDTDITTGGNTI